MQHILYTHALIPELVPPTSIKVIESQMIHVENLESDYSVEYEKAMAEYPLFIDVVAQLAKRNLHGVLGYYDPKWESNLMVDKRMKRHVNDSPDEVTRGYVSEFLARGSEMVRFGNSSGAMGYLADAKLTHDRLIVALSQPWFTDSYDFKLPRFLWTDLRDTNLPIHLWDSQSAALAFENSNSILVNQTLSSWGLMHTLCHELVHMLVRSPNSAHGRFFRFVHLWLWANLDTQFSTLMAPKLASLYNQFDLSWEPVS